MQIRVCDEQDIPALALIRAEEWGGPAYWQERIAGYLSGRLSPGQALAPRACFAAEHEGELAGFVAGHLTERFACAGELQWINVAGPHRRSGVGSELLRRMADWFVSQNARRVCVDVEPSNYAARAFYLRYGAVALNAHWLVWDDISCCGSTARPPITAA